MNILLTLINKTSEVTPIDVVVFQTNERAPDTAIAWKVITLKKGEHEKLKFPTELVVAVRDPKGNALPLLEAENGNRFDLIRSGTGQFRFIPGQFPAADPNTIETWNMLDSGNMEAHLYRDVIPVIRQADIAPGQDAVFQINQTIRMFADATGIQPGWQIEGSKLQSTAFPLDGIKSADIVITGKWGQPFVFTMENVEKEG